MILDVFRGYTVIRLLLKNEVKNDDNMKLFKNAKKVNFNTYCFLDIVFYWYRWKF